MKEGENKSKIKTERKHGTKMRWEGRNKAKEARLSNRKENQQKEREKERQNCSDTQRQAARQAGRLTDRHV